MHESIHIAGSKNKAGAELKRIAADPKLPVPRRSGPGSGLSIIPAKHVQHVRILQPSGAIGPAFLIDEQWKRDACLVPESPGVVPISKSDRRQIYTFRLERRFVFAQLRNVLAAKNSSIVAQKNNCCWTSFP